MKNIDTEFIERIMKELPVTIFYKDLDGKYLFATHYLSHIKNYDDPNWNIKGKTDVEIRKDLENAIKAQEIDKQIIKSGIGQSYIIEYTEEGTLEYLEIIKNPTFDENGNVTGIVGMINNVTQRVLQEKELEKLATQDQLTGLYNRAYLDIFYSKRNVEDIYPLGIIVADCNKLKQMNDNYGHLVGDEYIKKSANIMKIVLPDRSFIFRIGGDEFLAIIPNITQEELDNYVSEMNKLGKKIYISGNNISVSYGTNLVENYLDDLTYEINKADENMYVHKRRRKR